MNKTKKLFRERLNTWYAGSKHVHGRYHQLKRGYGDYLYYQDREKFNALYTVWKPTNTQEQFEARA